MSVQKVLVNCIFILLFAYVQSESILKCFQESFTETLCTWPAYIEVQSADYGTTSSPDPSQCNPDEKTCMQKVWTANRAYYAQILNACNGNQDCSSLPPVTYQTLPDCSYDQSHYVEIFYNCVADASTTTVTTGMTTTSTTGDSTLKCYGEVFTETLCTWPTVIVIQSVDYGITTAPSPDQCNREEKTCWQDAREVNADYYRQVQRACNGQHDCGGLLVDWENIPDCDHELSHYVEISFECIADTSTTTVTITIPSSTTITSTPDTILKCYGESFTETLCAGQAFVEVQSAYFGITTGSDAYNCNRDEKACWQDILEVNPEYYQQILNACNGNQDCSGLIADWDNIPDCAYQLSHYVEILYFCISL